MLSLLLALAAPSPDARLVYVGEVYVGRGRRGAGGLSLRAPGSAGGARARIGHARHLRRAGGAGGRAARHVRGRPRARGIRRGARSDRSARHGAGGGGPGAAGALAARQGAGARGGEARGGWPRGGRAHALRRDAGSLGRAGGWRAGAHPVRGARAAAHLPLRAEPGGGPRRGGDRGDASGEPVAATRGAPQSAGGGSRVAPGAALRGSCAAAAPSLRSAAAGPCGLHRRDRNHCVPDAAQSGSGAW